MNAPRILAWDIETRPHEVYRWSLFDKNPVGLSQIIRPGGMISYAARWIDEPKSSCTFVHAHGDTDAEVLDSKVQMLTSLYALFEEADGLVSWNGKGFDTKKANTEFIQLGWAPPPKPAEIDLMLAVKKVADFPSNKLEYIANILLGKGKVKNSGFDLWLRVMANDPKGWQDMGTYNRQDVNLLVDLYEYLLPWIDTIPNRNLFDGYDGCPKCGSDHIQRRGYRYTKVSKFARYQCLDCGGWSSVGKAEDRAEVR